MLEAEPRCCNYLPFFRAFLAVRSVSDDTLCWMPMAVAVSASRQSQTKVRRFAAHRLLATFNFAKCEQSVNQQPANVKSRTERI